MSTLLSAAAALEGARRVRIGANKPFLAQEAETLWLVESGFVDLFVVAVAEGRAAGERIHVMKLPRGSAFTGTPAVNGHAILIVGTVDTELLALPHALADQLLGDERLGAEMTGLLNEWMTRVRTSLAGEDAGPSDSWDPWYTLPRLEAAMIEGALRRKEEADSREVERRRQRAASDLEVFRGAMLGMAGVLGGEAGGAEHTSGDPMLQACLLVGEAMGVEMRHPARSLAGGRVDPVTAIARSSGLQVRRVLLRGGWWRQDSGPILGFLREGTAPVALLPLGPGRYELRDPRTDRRVRVDAEVADTLHPAARVFVRPLPAGPASRRTLLRFGWPGVRRDVWAVAAASLLAAVLGFAIPVATGVIVGELIPSGLRTQAVHLALGLLAASLGAGMFNIARAYSLMRIKGRLTSEVQAAVMARLLSLPPSFFRKYGTGEMTQRALGANTVSEGVAGAPTQVVLTGVFSFVNVALLLFYDVPLGLLAVGLLAVLVGVIVGSGAMQRHLLREQLAAEGHVAGRVYEIISGIGKLRVAAAEIRAFARWAATFTRQRQLTFRIRSLAVQVGVFQSVFPVVASLVLFVAEAATGYRMPSASFLAFYAAFGSLTAAVSGVGGMVPTLLYAGHTSLRMAPILTETPETDVERPDPGVLEGRLAVEGVSFRYSPDAPLALREVSLRVEPGEFVAIVGASGSGKSSLLRVLLGFERPESGRVLYDGQDMAHVDVRAIRRQIGVVLQTGQLMQGPIFLNIAGNGMYTMDEAWEAARVAGIDEDIRAMPMGMHTVVAEGGSTMSGGQRQRLMIARAVVSKPRYLFLDEATSALDSRVQEQVTQSLESLKVSRLVIAHRLSTIRRADRIYVMSGGAVVQSGTYEELLAQPGTFADLAQRQLL